MTDQSQTAANQQSEASLCKQGCGFFGNAATGGMCSKCWRDVQKTKSAVAAAVLPPPSPSSSPETCTVVKKANSFEKPLVMETAPVDLAAATTTTTPKTIAPEIAVTETPVVTETAPAPVANAPAKKKKKKKTSYKNMMASVMKETTKDATTKDDVIRRVTGGGAFSKIEKI